MTISKVCTRIIRGSIGYSFRFLINPLANKLPFHGGDSQILGSSGLSFYTSFVLCLKGYL